MFTSASAAPPAVTLPLFLPQTPSDKVVRPDSCRNPVRARPRERPRPRQPRVAVRDGGSVRRQRRRRRLGMEGRLRGARSGPDAVPAKIRQRDALPRRLGRGDARDAQSLARRLASQTRRSKESERLQQFSTPSALGFVAAEAAAQPPATRSRTVGRDRVARDLRRTRQSPARLERDRRDPRRAPRSPVPRVSVSRHNAEQIHDRLDAAIRPSVVLMNPPFSASPHVEGRFAEAAMRHIGSAFARLAEGGGSSRSPATISDPISRPGARLRTPSTKGPRRLHRHDRGKAYVRHGTSMQARLTVIDRIPGREPGLSALARNGCRCRRIARPGFSSRPAAPPKVDPLHSPAPSGLRFPAPTCRTRGQRFRRRSSSRQPPGINPGHRGDRIRDPPVDARRDPTRLNRQPLRRLRVANDAYS